MQYQGVVSNVSYFDYQGKKLWSFQLNSEKGVFYRTGNDKPSVEQGNFVVFEGAPGNKPNSVNVKAYNINVKQGEQTATGVSAGVVATGNTKSNDSPVSPNEDRRYETKADREARNTRIELQSCRNSALEFVKILLSKDAIKFPAKGDAVAILEGALDHYTKQFVEENQGKEPQAAQPVQEDSDDQVPY